MSELKLRRGYGNFILPTEDLPYDGPNPPDREYAPGGYVDFSDQPDNAAMLIGNLSASLPLTRTGPPVITFGQTSEQPWYGGPSTTSSWDRDPSVGPTTGRITDQSRTANFGAWSGTITVVLLPPVNFDQSIDYQLRTNPSLPPGTVLDLDNTMLIVRTIDDAGTTGSSQGNDGVNAQNHPYLSEEATYNVGVAVGQSLVFVELLATNPFRDIALWTAGSGAAANPRLLQAFQVAQPTRISGVNLYTLASQTANPGGGLYALLCTAPSGDDEDILLRSAAVQPNDAYVTAEFPSTVELQPDTNYWVGAAGFNTAAMAIDYDGTIDGSRYAPATQPGLWVDGQFAGVSRTLRLELLSTTPCRTQAVIYGAKSDIGIN